MNIRRTARRNAKAAQAGLALLSLFRLLSTSALAQDEPSKLVLGGSGTMFGAEVTTWARLAPDGTVLTAGATVPLALIERAPAAQRGAVGMTAMGAQPTVYTPFALDFPAAVRQTTFLDHLDLGWAPGGHPPVYLTPHFDIHFFTISRPAVAAIDCTNPVQASPAQLAPGYVPAMPPNQQPSDVCVPFMGFHSLPAADLAPGKTFDKTMLAVYYGGQLNAIEPMVTRETLLKKRSFRLPVPALPMIGQATRFPTAFEAVYNPDRNAYDLTFSNFVPMKR